MSSRGFLTSTDSTESYSEFSASSPPAPRTPRTPKSPLLYANRSDYFERSNRGNDITIHVCQILIVMGFVIF